MREKPKEATNLSAANSGTISLGSELTVNRLGFGAMRITGEGIWGSPKDPAAAVAVLRHAVELGVNFIDTADSYGPNVSEELIAEALADGMLSEDARDVVRCGADAECDLASRLEACPLGKVKTGIVPAPAALRRIVDIVGLTSCRRGSEVV